MSFAAATPTRRRTIPCRHPDRRRRHGRFHRQLSQHDVTVPVTCCIDRDRQCGDQPLGRQMSVTKDPEANWAATFVASLDLAKQGEVVLGQGEETIHVAPAQDPSPP